jgi:hypothetical protein
LFVLKPFPFPFYPVLHKDFSENHHEFSGTIDIILNKNYVSMLSFSGVFNPPGFYWGSACIVFGSVGLCLDRPGLCLGQPGLFRRHPGTTGEAPA